MTLTIAFGWWAIPTLVTVMACGYALFGHKDGGGMFSGIGNIFLLVPALLISMVSWIIAGALK